MTVFVVVAQDPASGQRTSFEIDATDEKSAAKMATDRRLMPISVTNKAARGHRISIPFLSGRIGTKDKVLFSRQMASLLGAGIPLIQSLSMVGDQIKNKSFKGIVSQIASDIEGGTSFSEALGRYPAVFDRAYIGVIAAGETTGGISKAMLRLADQQERDSETMGKIKGAMIYPCVVIGVIVAVAAFMIVKVLPQVQSLYKGFPGATLPLFTRVLLGVSHIISRYWWVLLIVFGLILFFSMRWTRTLAGRRFLDRMKLDLPPLNKLFRKLYMARFSVNMGTLLQSGVPLLQALDITAEAIGNIYIANSLKAASVEVKGGKALSSTLMGDPNFLDLVPSMLQIGEKSGTVSAMMDKTAEYYQKELDTEIQNITTIIEPAMMIIVGIMALILVAAILLPIYGLVGKIS